MKQVALLLDKQELEDVQMALLALHNKWVINADMSESQEYITGCNSLEELKKLQWKVNTLLQEELLMFTENKHEDPEDVKQIQTFNLVRCGHLHLDDWALVCTALKALLSTLEKSEAECMVTC